MSDTYESERVILGCAAMFPDIYADRLNALSMDMFTDAVHHDIFNALHTANKKAPQRYDPQLIVSFLHERDSAAELTHCCQIVFRTSPFDEHFSVLLNSAKDRFIREQVESAIMGGKLTAERLREIAELANGAYADDANRDRREQYDRYLDEMCKPRQTLYLRYRKLDNVLGGIRAGTLTIIGARPSVGKTTLSLNLAQNIAGYGRKVVFFSLEMTAQDILEKLAARGCSLDYRELHHHPTPAMQGRIRDYFAQSGLRDRLTVVDDMNTVEAICGYIAAHKPDVAVIDYAQLVDTLSRQENTRIKTGYISAQLKGIAKRTGCRVILLSQLRRPESDTVKPPGMSDLKESSALEQDGDYILMLFRPYTQDKQKYTPDEAAVYIEKNRFGATGQVQLTFDGAHQVFKEVSHGQ